MSEPKFSPHQPSLVVLDGDGPGDPINDRVVVCDQCGHTIFVTTPSPRAAPPAHLDPDDYEYTVREVCQILRVSDRWVRRLIAEGRLRATRLSADGRSTRWRVSQKALQEFRAGHVLVPKEE